MGVTGRLCTPELKSTPPPGKIKLASPRVQWELRKFWLFVSSSDFFLSFYPESFKQIFYRNSFLNFFPPRWIKTFFSPYTPPKHQAKSVQDHNADEAVFFLNYYSFLFKFCFFQGHRTRVFWDPVNKNQWFWKLKKRKSSAHRGYIRV